MDGEQLSAEDAALDAIDDILGPEEEEEVTGDEGDDLEAEEGDEAAEDDAAESEEGEEGDEPAPALEAPHSWSKEDKAIWGDLTPEAQAVVARREKERDAFVNAKAREAADTRRVVETEARDIVTKLYQNHAQQLQAYAQQILPQAPDERLLYTGNPDDVTSYHRQEAAYRRAMGQQQALHQEIAQAQQAAQTAQERSQQEAIAADAQRLRDDLPEWFDKDAGPALQQSLQAIGAELGYSPEVMSEASSSDILALNKALGWKQDAEKYRSLMSKKMETVRAAKGLPKMAKPGVKPSKQQLNATNSQKAWDRVKASKAKDGDAIADWLGLK